jgi:peptidyl-prolyl cis-trans isomerase B (cyclophilin B)
MVDDAEELNPIDVTITTDEGDIEVTLFAARAPRTVANWLNLARQGFYDDLTFHRVVDDFMIQGGDPDGNGRGGPGYQFDDEFHPDLEHDSAGTLSMANSGPNTNGSQFFITHKPTPHLDGDHAVFGEVTEGQDIVDSISEGDRILNVEIHDDPEPLFDLKSDRIEEWNEALS